MAGRGGRGAGDFFKKLVLWLVGLGFLLALLRIYHMDPFGVINWCVETFWNIVNRIGNYFSNNATFRHIFSKPQGK